MCFYLVSQINLNKFKSIVFKINYVKFQLLFQFHVSLGLYVLGSITALVPINSGALRFSGPVPYKLLYFASYFQFAISVPHNPV